MRRISLFILVASTTISGAGCKEDPKRPPVAGDLAPQPGIGGVAGGGGTSPEGGSPDGDGQDAGLCTALPITGAVIDQQAISEDVPVGRGGQILDGTYDLTAARLYVGPGNLPGLTGNSYQASIRIAASQLERVEVYRSAGGAASESRALGTIAVTSPNGTISLSCPSATQESITYSVLGDSLEISNLITKVSFTFTRKL